MRLSRSFALPVLRDVAQVRIADAGRRARCRERQWEAINALGRVHSDETVEYLLRVLESPSVRDRQEAVLTLGLIGTDDARRAVLGSLGDPEAQVRWRAALVLSRGELTAEVLLALEYVVQRDPDAKVREQARASLSRLQAPGY